MKLFYIQYNIFCYPRIYIDLYHQTRNNKSVTGLELHALHLHCLFSGHDNSGTRETQVENPQASFSSPPVLLTQYLEQSNKPSVS